MVTPLKHVQESITLHLNTKKFKFYTRRSFCSYKATTYDAAFFNIKFFVIFCLHIIKSSVISLACL